MDYYETNAESICKQRKDYETNIDFLCRKWIALKLMLIPFASRKKITTNLTLIPFDQ